MEEEAHLWVLRNIMCWTAGQLGSASLGSIGTSLGTWEQGHGKIENCTIYFKILYLIALRSLNNTNALESVVHPTISHTIDYTFGVAQLPLLGVSCTHGGHSSCPKDVLDSRANTAPCTEGVLDSLGQRFIVLEVLHR